MDPSLFFTWLEEHEKLAGWAQAVGGLLAIGAAIVIARSDHAAAEGRRRARQVSLILTATTMTDAAQVQADGLIANLIDRELWPLIKREGVDDNQIAGAIADIESFPAHELDSLQVGFHMRRFRVFLRYLHKAADGIVKTINRSGKPSADQIAYLEGLRDRLYECTETVLKASQSAMAVQKPSWPWLKSKD
ncbi:hypothetical protein [Caulobacter sp. LARHSG274]